MGAWLAGDDCLCIKRGDLIAAFATIALTMVLTKSQTHTENHGLIEYSEHSERKSMQHFLPLVHYSPAVG